MDIVVVQIDECLHAICNDLLHYKLFHYWFGLFIFCLIKDIVTQTVQI